MAVYDLSTQKHMVRFHSVVDFVSPSVSIVVLFRAAHSKIMINDHLVDHLVKQQDLLICQRDTDFPFVTEHR